MSTMVPMYGFGGGSGGAGASLTVNAPAGCTVTVSKDGKTKTKTAGADGTAVFRGLATGQWTVTITDGSQTAQKTVTITADYAAAITFFSATIHVTYPAGSTCTATDGVTTLTAPDTSGTWDCVLPNAGTWTVSLDSGFAENVEITQNGEEKTIDKWYLYNLGDECTAVTGGWEGVAIGEAGSPAIPMALNIARNDDNMYFYGDEKETSVGCGICKNKIDVTGFNKIAFEGTLDAHSQYTYAHFRLWSNLSGDIHNNVIAEKYVKQTVVTDAEIDLSSVNGECVIGFALLGKSGYSWVTMRQLYLMV